MSKKRTRLQLKSQEIQKEIQKEEHYNLKRRKVLFDDLSQWNFDSLTVEELKQWKVLFSNRLKETEEKLNQIDQKQIFYVAYKSELVFWKCESKTKSLESCIQTIGNLFQVKGYMSESLFRTYDNKYWASKLNVDFVTHLSELVSETLASSTEFESHYKQMDTLQYGLFDSLYLTCQKNCICENESLSNTDSFSTEQKLADFIPKRAPSLGDLLND
jgi:hypothetical protein